RVQRKILWNQFEILKHLEPQRSKDYRRHQETLESGYSSYYDDVMEMVSEDEADEHMQQETIKILEMFRALDQTKTRGWVPSNPDRAVFQGFDGNNDDHYHFARYLLETRELFEESGKRPHNSHSIATLPRYRKMMQAWQNCADPWSLSDQDAEAIIA
ncbi:MAG: YfbU family protein, partial [Pseudomonadales bacterium]